ncbi:hypothetical protein LCGC14_0812870 [marine sediment metagenome]|uniref:Uncharacterized protein n=1 Tax=marine sediment metagenome TaxID=412755 RepID=A0A0F9Q6B2_9ZZZZ
MRITERDLKNTIDRINKVTGKPMGQYSTDKDGKSKGNIGNYHLDCAYGGYALHQMTNEHGGVRQLFSGHGTKRELYDKMHAYLGGLDDSNK